MSGMQDQSVVEMVVGQKCIVKKMQIAVFLFARCENYLGKLLKSFVLGF